MSPCTEGEEVGGQLGRCWADAGPSAVQLSSQDNWKTTTLASLKSPQKRQPSGWAAAGVSSLGRRLGEAPWLCWAQSCLLGSRSARPPQPAGEVGALRWVAKLDTSEPFPG